MGACVCGACMHAFMQAGVCVRVHACVCVCACVYVYHGSPIIVPCCHIKQCILNMHMRAVDHTESMCLFIYIQIF